jgi:hypothetical protein
MEYLGLYDKGNDKDFFTMFARQHALRAVAFEVYILKRYLNNPGSSLCLTWFIIRDMVQNDWYKSLLISLY